jgi:hypothetical protein
MPATVINNDKLVSMYGNLLAKKKSEEDAYQKGLIDQMAKIDAAGIKAEDIDDYNKMYNDYVKFGTDNIKSLTDPAVQVQLKQKENQIKGFITLSKANKEEDVKALAYTSPNYDPNTRKYADSFIRTKTLDRKDRFDYTKATKVDRNDYINDIAKGIDPKVIVTQGNFKLTNPESTYPKIQALIEDNIRAQENTITGQNALAQFAVNADIDISDPANKANKEQAIKGLAKAVFDIKKASLDKSMTEFGKQKEESDSKEAARLGYSSKNVPAMQFVADTAVQIAKGDSKALEKLKQMSLGALEYEDNGESVKIYEIKDSKPVLIQTLYRTLKPQEFSEQMLAFLNKFGIDSGIKQVSLGEYRNFLASKGNKYFLTAKPIPGTKYNEFRLKQESASANKTKTTTSQQPAGKVR